MITAVWSLVNVEYLGLTETANYNVQTKLD